MHRYAELCDAAYDPDGLAALFTEDATWSSRTRDGSVDFGRYEGREAIRAFFAGASRDLGPMTLHYLLAPRVELAEDGESATGVCYLALKALSRSTESLPPVRNQAPRSRSSVADSR